MSTLAEDIEIRLREEIVRGTFAPSSRLQMEDLKARFGVGMSPIREALSRLTSEGVVLFESNKGFRVPELSRDDLFDIAVTRAAVEVAALRLAMRRGDNAWEGQILAALHSYKRFSSQAFESVEGLESWEDAHDMLHAALVSACSSPRLIELQQRLQKQHVRYRRLITDDTLDVNIPVREHEILVDAVLSKNEGEAVRLIADHMMITVDVLDQRGHWLRPMTQ